MESSGTWNSPIELWWSELSPSDRRRVEEAAAGGPLTPDLVAGMGRFHIEAIRSDDHAAEYGYHLPTVVREFVLGQSD